MANTFATNDVPTVFTDFVRQAMSTFKCSAHDFEHVMRVSNLALSIAKQELPQPNLKIVYVASLSHDVMDSKLVSSETASSNETQLRHQLANFLTEDECTEVIAIVKAVGYKNLIREGWDPQARSIEYRCVQDADLIDAIGAIGIGRCFSFGGGRNRDLFGLEDSLEAITAEQYAAQSQHVAAGTGGVDTSSTKGLSGVQHFFDKLLQIPSIMTTKTGRAIAQTRLETMLVYLRLLVDELTDAGSVDGIILKKKIDHFLLQNSLK